MRIFTVTLLVLCITVSSVYGQEDSASKAETRRSILEMGKGIFDGSVEVNFLKRIDGPLQFASFTIPPSIRTKTELLLRRNGIPIDTNMTTGLKRHGDITVYLKTIEPVKEKKATSLSAFYVKLEITNRKYAKGPDGKFVWVDKTFEDDMVYYFAKSDEYSLEKRLWQRLEPMLDKFCIHYLKAHPVNRTSEGGGLQ